MKIKLLLFFSICCLVKSNGQCGGTPPPPGADYVYALDTDNDGHATFDMDYYITNVQRPNLESIFGVSSSGYNLTFQDLFGPVLPLQYTNVTANEDHFVVATYSGSGPVFEPQPMVLWSRRLGSSYGILQV